MWTRQEEKRVNGNNSSLDKVQLKYGSMVNECHKK